MTYNYDNNENYVSYFNGKNNYTLNQIFINSLSSLANIIGIIEEYENEDSKSLIEDMKECYSIYQTYKYKYYRDINKERKLLEKCKKM